MGCGEQESIVEGFAATIVQCDTSLNGAARDMNAPVKRGGRRQLG